MTKAEAVEILGTAHAAYLETQTVADIELLMDSYLETGALREAEAYGAIITARQWYESAREQIKRSEMVLSLVGDDLANPAAREARYALIGAHKVLEEVR